MATCPSCYTIYSDDLSECPDDSSALLPDDSFQTADPPLQSGTMVGEYRVDKKLGAGTFGAVYAGEQPLIGKKVAIKVLHRRYSADPEMVSRFIAEARAVNRIRHRNIIDIFSFGLIEDSQHYFVMELLDGLTLGELLEQEGPLSVARALPILQGMADGLDAAHETGITHRDLKPDNVFLAREKNGSFFAKLLDFGIAKLGAAEAAHKTATGVAVGTPRYMAPEQSRGKKIDHRADIYALGVVTHEMLTGKPPFEGDSVLDVMFKHATEPPPAMSTVRPNLPSKLNAPVLAMLQKDPAKRPASAGQAIQALTEVAKSLGLDVEQTVTLSQQEATARAHEEHANQTTVRVQHPPAADQPTLPTQASPVQDATSSAPETTEIEASNRPAADPHITMKSPEWSQGQTMPAAPMPVQTAADTLSSGETAIPSTPQPARPQRSWVVPVAVLAGVGIAIIAFMETRSKPVPATSDTTHVPSADITSAPIPSATVQPTTLATAATTTEVLGNTVNIRLAVIPLDAEVQMDGRKIGMASDPLVLPRSSERFTLRIVRQGYESQTVWVTPDRDQDLPPIALSAIPKAGTSPTKKPHERDFEPLGSPK